MSFRKNHFGEQAAEYRRFRPTYPRSLFEFLADASGGRRLAWDCGTGNGQAAIALAEVFDRVVASDASLEQIRAAELHERVEYCVAPAEACPFRPSSVDLVAVAQAAHWFDLERFYAEVRRTVRPGGVVALWCYTLLEIDPAIDSRIERFYSEVVGPYWPKERAQVERCYRDLPFPFEQIPPPAASMEAEWDFAQLIGYVETWSPVRIFRRERSHDPVPELAEPLAALWGEPSRSRRVRFPLHFRIGRV